MWHYTTATEFPDTVLLLDLLAARKGDLQILKTESIKRFLLSSTHPDLAALYDYNMEVQINVASDGHEAIEGDYKGRRWRGFTNGIDIWKPFRIPWNANSEPEYHDTNMTYDLVKHAEGIGMTGWDWKNQLSRWVAFDFDAIVGHSEKHANKLTDMELREVEQAVADIPWVTVRSSTSGSGLHLYVFLETPEPTKTHTEHAALARAILGNMSAITGKNLSTKVDACGQNMWVWHRKMEGTSGLTITKKGSLLSKVPVNWKDHIQVISGRRKKTRPSFIPGKDDSSKTEEELMFEELSGQRNETKLDESHKTLIKWLEDNKDYYYSFDNDNGMIVTHTFALKIAFKELGLRGVYDTLSEGKDSTQNCFMFPMKNGAWVVRRFTPGVQEAPNWDQDRKNWTRCFFNREPDLKTVARVYGGNEVKGGGFVFNVVVKAMEVAKILGGTINVPQDIALSKRTVKLMYNKDGRLIVELEAGSTDQNADMSNWVKSTKQKWTQIVNAKSPPKNEIEVGNYDDVVRHIIDIEGSDLGWMIFSDGGWHSEPLQHVYKFMATFGLDDKEVSIIIGNSIARPWTIVNLPFQNEYPGGRKWNRNAPQFRFPPSEAMDVYNSPSWNKILNHCGSSLDQYIKEHQWCKTNGIKTGGEYLKCWVASCFQHPEEPLPYLYFYGPQNSGKSIFHEALELLVTRGIVRADHALSDTTFNGEIEGAVVCVIEETDINAKKGKAVYNKIKDWTNSRTISIRRLYQTPYSIVNTTHWVQCSNEKDSVPLFPGDSRIVMIYVPELSPDELIAKRDLIRALTKEAPDFLASVLNLELPECKDRLNLPVIETADKAEMQEEKLSDLEIFIQTKCFYVPGKAVKLGELYNAFIDQLDPMKIDHWSKIQFGRELDKNKFPKGRLQEADMMIGNISFDPPTPEDSRRPKLVLDVSKGKLVPTK